VDLFEELTQLVDRLQARKIEFAVCGGLAMAVYAIPRATIDIDLMILSESLDETLVVAGELGYASDEGQLKLADGAVVIRRLTKIDSQSGDFLTLDLILVTPALQAVWTGREMVEWEGGRLCVVSRNGLKAMKRLRGSGQDQDDIKRLDEIDDD
jgi:hypothetical protein